MASGRTQADLQANRLIPPGGARAAGVEERWSGVRHLERVVTVEVALYGVAILVAVLLRLVLLDRRPLSAEEGALASQSFRVMQGQMPDSLIDGPLQTYGTALALGLFGAGDWAARLWSAVAGTLLVAGVYLARGMVGRGAALLAAFGLAVSPLLLFASREVGSGAVPAALAILTLWAAPRAMRMVDGRSQYVAGTLLGLLVASGQPGITVLVTLGLAVVLSDPNPGELVAQARKAWALAVWRRGALVFLATALLVGTAFGANLRGVQAILVDGWTGWLGSFSLLPNRGTLLLAMLLYEFPVLLLAAGSLWHTVRLRERVDIFLSIWAMLLLLVGLLQSPLSLAHMVLPMVPAYLIGGRAASGALPRVWRSKLDWRWVVAAVGVASPALVGIVLLNRSAILGEVIPQPFLGGEAALVIAGVVLYALVLDGRARWSVGIAGIAALGMAFTIHSTVFLNYRSESISKEVIAGVQVSPTLRDVAAEAAYFSTYSGTSVVIDPQLRSAVEWYVRGAPRVQFGAAGSEGVSIRTAQAGQSVPSGAERVPGIYSPTIDAGGLSWRGIWAWLMSRDGLVQTNQRDIIFRAPVGTGGQD